MTKTVIAFNGSKWAGEPPDGLEKLLETLKSEPLNPRFKHFDYPVVPGTFIFGVPEELQGCTRHFFGNFYRVSHAFSVFTDDDEVIETLSKAIGENVAGEPYREALRELKEPWKCG